MRMLIIGEEEKTELQRVRAYAEANHITSDDILDMINGVKPVPGDLPGYVCKIPTNYRIVFSIEEQSVAHVRHVSISLMDATDGKVANIHALRMILPLLGFESDVAECKVAITPLHDTGINVIDVLEPIAGTYAKN